MTQKGGTFFLLLIVVCAAMATSIYQMSDNGLAFKDTAKKLMRKCREKGYPRPEMALVKSTFNNSASPPEYRNSAQSSTFISTFLNLLDLVLPGENSNGKLRMKNEMINRIMNCSHLLAMIKLMRNSSVTVTTRSENLDSNDYDMLLQASKPALQVLPCSKTNFPLKEEHQNVKMMLKMLQSVNVTTCRNQRNLVVQWAKDQITQNKFNCTVRPSSDARLAHMQRCKPSLKWLDKEAMTMLGQYLSNLAPSDVDSSPKEKLCEFFSSAGFSSTLSKVQTSPSLAKRFLKRFKECFKGEEEFATHVDKLGTLACYYDTKAKLTTDLSKKLLSELENCNNPKIRKLKRRLVKYLMTNSNTAQAIKDLNSSIVLLSPKQLSEISAEDLKEVLKNPSIQWTKGQLQALVKKQLGGQCKRMSGKEFKTLLSVARGLPSCVLKRINANGILNDTEALRDMGKHMRKGQLKAMLQGLGEDMDSVKLVEKLDGELLKCIPHSNLENITSVENKTWSLSQAAYLMKKMYRSKKSRFWRLGSVLQGVTCKMIDEVEDNEVEDMVQAVTETPQWLSKLQAACAARKLFATLEKKRVDYFKTISEEEMDEIPTSALLLLPPQKVRDLPDSVCPVLLDKMELANLSLVPSRAPSRVALTTKALLCLTNGTDLSGLTVEDVSRLGPLLCELNSSQLSLTALDVLRYSLQSMASCQRIPKRHRADIIQLVKQTFGDPSDWSAETMEELGPLLLLDDNATSALPKKSWMKDVLIFLRSRMSVCPDALKKKIFDLTITESPTSIGARKKRAADNSNSNGNGNANSNTDSGTDSTNTTETAVLSLETIEQVGMDNSYWTAEQLDQMSDEIFLQAVETLGKVTNYNADQLAVLSGKAIKAFGPVSDLTDEEVLQLGCIAQGFSDTDLEKLPLLLDNVEEFASCGWNDSQLVLVWRAVAKYNNLTVQQLGAAEMVLLSRFICGLSSDEIAQLDTDAFKEAVGLMTDLQCPIEVMQQLKNLAVSAFGDPKTWTEAQVTDLGNMIAGLDATELASLDPSVCSFVSASCIPLIPPANFAAFSVDQLEALGPDNAAMVTSEQRLALSDEQVAALERAATGSREQMQTTSQSRAPSLNVEGFSAFMKPLLFLLTVFLLL